jgi:hypothetical protein
MQEKGKNLLMKRLFVPEGWNRARGKQLYDLVAVRGRDPNVLIHMIPNNKRGLSRRQKHNDVSHSELLGYFFSHVPISNSSRASKVRMSELDVYIRLQ